jgi:hypothetical protein
VESGLWTFGSSWLGSVALGSHMGHIFPEGTRQRLVMGGFYILHRWVIHYLQMCGTKDGCRDIGLAF